MAAFLRDDSLGWGLQVAFASYHRRLLYELAVERLRTEAFSYGTLYVCGLLAPPSSEARLVGLEHAHDMIGAHLRWRFWSVLRQPTLPFPGWDDDAERLRRFWLREFRRAAERLFVEGDPDIALFAVMMVFYYDELPSARAIRHLVTMLCDEYPELKSVYYQWNLPRRKATRREAPGAEDAAG